MAVERSRFRSGRAAPAVQVRRLSSEGAVTTQDAIYQTADQGNAVAWAVMTTWMAGGRRTSRHRHATQSDCGGESDECFMKHVILLIMAQTKNCCEEYNNAGLPLRVASHADTFAC